MTSQQKLAGQAGPTTSQENNAALGARRWALVLALSLALVLTYHEYLQWMLDRWWVNEYYGHGFLIPLISGYLIYRQRTKLASLPAGSNIWGLPVIVLSLLLHLEALYRGAHFPSGFALIGTMFGLVIWLWGWPRARALLFPLAFLVFMVPMARLLVDQLAQPLQLFSARGAGVVANLLGVQTQTEGTMIVTRDYTFEVAIPCSGLKSIIAMSALGALIAYLVEGPRWKRLLLFLMAFPVALLANLIRIFVTLVLGNSLGPATAEGFFHTCSGAMVFIVAFAGLMLIGGVLGCRQMRADI